MQSNEPSEAQHTFDATTNTDDNSFTALWHSHRQLFTKALQLGALEGKIWLASSAQLLALMCGVLLLLSSAWLVLLALVAVLLWQAGLPLVAVMLTTALLLVASAALLFIAIKRTLKRMDITRLLDALINDDKPAATSATAQEEASRV